MADKLDMKSMDITQENIAKIRALFPAAVTEVMGEDGKPRLAIDFDILKQELSADLIEEKQERYQMTWPDKSKAKVLANSRITATLRPDREKSVNFDTTENLYIEGDNLDVLKLLRETYLGKVKMIYIDPPYNTGNDFVYEDDFAMSTEDYEEVSGQYDEQGNRLVKNLDSNGRFHTDWLNMIYPRLKIARDLLSENGVIFISLDDNEQANLKKICDEIFGEQNKVGELMVIRAEGGGLAKQIIKGHDYLFVYAKNIHVFTPLGREKDIRGKIIEKDGETYWIQEDWLRKEFGKYGNCHYEEILEYKGQKTLNEVNQEIRKGNYILIPKDNGMHIVGKLRNIKEDASKFYSVLKHLSANGIKDLDTLDLSKYFSYPKPISLIKELILGATFFTSKSHDIILDFFSGSATTAHAVMQLNAEDGGNRKFIMVQLPEQCDPKSEAYKAGYRTICDIGEERIRRAGKKIKETKYKITLTHEITPDEPEEEEISFFQKHLHEKYKGETKFSMQSLHPQDLDIGFRVLRLDSSNMQEVYYNPAAMTQSLLETTVDNVKPDRTPLDLLFQVMLDLGIELSAKIEEHSINGKAYYAVNGNDIIACFDDDIDNDVITAIAKQLPLYAVFKDKSFATDSVGINNEQLFKTYSPATVVKVI